ncbi:Nif3-like dinuclear metal center hexameric protein [Oceanobacillus saliphilus]|uniref:Nif3-like dinuclear metal center hexameric protein n=1 Tax=Oceanobacillus saliphilus TaxID=2925834 RepID=UPI00201E0335|nr:Nif3-like dinuclear metal center hexameric protein [Oceanobacillus saliphilus]
MNTKVLNNSDIFTAMENWAPKRLAYDWDNVGLQIGSYQTPVKKILVTLDVTESVVDEAIDKGAGLIIAHHPLLFKPMKQVNIDTAHGKIIQKLIRNGITVYASHTNLDAADGGVNDILSDLLGIESREVLVETTNEKRYKLAVYVPQTHVEEVREALSKSGAGHIGNYSHCTFQSKGQGTFKPLEGANPYIGSENELEYVNEIKMETIVQQSNLQNTIHHMIDAHPYEEVAYDIYPVISEGKSYGIGRIGTLKAPMELRELCGHVKKVLDVPALRLTGNLDRKVSKIAVLGGSGEKYIQIAKQKGADVYITGDMSFHIAQEAEQMGLSVIDPGHYVEKVMKKATKEYLNRQFKQEKMEIIISETNTEPFKFM